MKKIILIVLMLLFVPIMAISANGIPYLTYTYSSTNRRRYKNHIKSYKNHTKSYKIRRDLATFQVTIRPQASLLSHIKATCGVVLRPHF